MNNTCDQNIFSTFFNKNVKSLRNYIYYKFGNEEIAEDVTQEAFIKLWQNCKDVSIEKAKGYIYTIANNLSLNEIKHQKVVLNFEKKSSISEVTIESPHFQMEEKEFENQLNAAIQNLTETQRIAFLMSRIDGKKYTEIAEELGISVKAVEKRIHLALIELKNCLKNVKL